MNEIHLFALIFIATTLKVYSRATIQFTFRLINSLDTVKKNFEIFIFLTENLMCLLSNVEIAFSMTYKKKVRENLRKYPQAFIVVSWVRRFNQRKTEEFQA